MSIRRALREPLQLHGLYSGEQQLGEVAQRVNLEQEHLDRLPHQLSGGQKQRVGVARAMMTRPKLIILDEPTSSLDMSLRIHVIALLRKLQREFALSYIFISHDLSTIRHLCDRVLVMYLGRVVEQGRTADVFDHPTHVYTQALLSAIPIPDPTVRRSRILLKGETPTARVPGAWMRPTGPLRLGNGRVPAPGAGVRPRGRASSGLPPGPGEPAVPACGSTSRCVRVELTPPASSLAIANGARRRACQDSPRLLRDVTEPYAQVGGVKGRRVHACRAGDPGRGEGMGGRARRSARASAGEAPARSEGFPLRRRA